MVVVAPYTRLQQSDGGVVVMQTVDGAQVQQTVASIGDAVVVRSPFRRVRSVNDYHVRCLKNMDSLQTSQHHENHYLTLIYSLLLLLIAVMYLFIVYLHRIVRLEHAITLGALMHGVHPQMSVQILGRTRTILTPRTRVLRIPL